MRSLVVVVLLAGCGLPELVGPNGVPDATSRASLSIDPPSAEIAALATTQFTITNTGQDPTSSIVLEITGANSLDFLIADPSCTTLAPGKTCVVGVYSFGRTHDATAKLHAFDTIDPSIAATADLTSSGDSLAVSVPTIPYTPINGQSASVTVTVSNPTNMASGSLSIMLSDQFAKVSDATSDTCTGQSLDPGGPGCSFELVFTPNGDPSNPTRNGTVTVMGMPVSGMANMTGTIVPLIEVDTSLATGPTLLTCASPIDSKIYTYTNPTGMQLTMTIPALANGSSSELGIHMTTCTTTLNAGQSCMVAIIANTTSSGARTGTLEVKASQGNAQLTLDTPIAVTVGCDFVVSPSSWNFSTVPDGTTSVAKAFTVTNTSISTMSHLVMPITLGGTNANQFTIATDMCSGVTLLPSSSCMVAVAYRPMLQAAASATLVVTTAGRMIPVVNLTGTGTASTLMITPSSYQFPLTAPTSISMPTIFTVTSEAPTAGPLMIQATTSFTVLQNNCTNGLAAMGSCTVIAAFAPMGSGTLTSGFLTASTVGASADAPLSGTATPQIAISPPLATIATGDTVMFTVSNTSDVATGQITIQSSGPYVVAPTCIGMSLAANGGKCVFSVTNGSGGAGTDPQTLTVSGSPGGTASAMILGGP